MDRRAIRFVPSSIETTALEDRSLLTAPPVAFASSQLVATWAGQDAQAGSGSPNGLALGDGLVHINVANFAQNSTIKGAELSDAAGNIWFAGNIGATPSQPPGNTYQPLSYPTSPLTAGSAVITFPPARSETGTTMTLVLSVTSNNNITADSEVQFQGGYADQGQDEPTVSQALSRPRSPSR